MKGPIAFFFVFLLLLLCLSTIQSIKAQTLENIFINPDGSVTRTSNIQRNGNNYTLTSNILGSIQVQKSNVIIDGAGYTIQGSGTGTGFDLSNGSGGDPSRASINNVTIMNTQIVNFTAGIYSTNSKDNIFTQNYIANCDSGILVMGGENYLITANTFENNANAISIDYSKGTASTITKNNLLNNDIIVWMSTKPVIELNYYSNYTAKYPAAKEIGDTGVWDTPYRSKWSVDTKPLVHRITENMIPELQTWTIFLLAVPMVLMVVYSKIFKKRMVNFGIRL